jgi:hypothetical protein
VPAEPGQRADVVSCFHDVDFSCPFGQGQALEKKNKLRRMSDRTALKYEFGHSDVLSQKSASSIMVDVLCAGCVRNSLYKNLIAT